MLYVLVLVLVLVVVITLVGVGVFLYRRSVSKDTDAPVGISNPGYKMFLDLESSQKKRDEFRKLVPSYVSKDVYKDMNRDERNKRFLDDYFYMLDLAIRSYQANPKGVSAVMTKEEYLPILAWAKFSVDYDKYTRDLDAKAYESRFTSTYGKTPDIDKIMAFMRSVQDMYSKDQGSFDRAIFGDKVSGESLVPGCASYSPKEKIVYQELYIAKKPTDVCLYALEKNAYFGLRSDVMERRFPSDFWMLLRLAINAYDEGKPSFEQAMKQQKFLPLLVFARFAVVNRDYVKSVPSEIAGMYVSQNIDLLAREDALKLIDTLVSRYRSNPAEIDSILYTACTSAGVTTQQEAPKPAKKEPNSYLLMPAEQRNEAVLYDFLEVFKKAVESIVSNKAELLNTYQSRRSDADFLKLYSFVPVLYYAKFIEDNKDYLNQIDPNVRKQRLLSLYPDFTTSERFYVQGIHVQVFLIIASNLYIQSPMEVNTAIYGAPS